MYTSTVVFGLVLLATSLGAIGCSNDFRAWFAICEEKRLDSGFDVLYEFPVSSKQQCVIACKDEKKCLSVNIARKTLGYTCQLMSSTPVDCESLTQDTTSIHIKLKPQICINGGQWNFTENNCGTCNYGFAGTFCERYIIDCKEGQLNGQISGGRMLVNVQPVNSLKPFLVKCIFRYGITEIEHRGTSDTFGNFNRTWSEYKEGFGNMNNSYFIGLQNLYLLTNQRVAKLKVQAMNVDSNHHSYYLSFRLDSESNNYTMHYGNFFSNPGGNEGGDGFGMASPNASLNHAPFCTPDRDCHSCAAISSSGWWFNKNCAEINMHIPSDGSQLKWPKKPNNYTTSTITDLYFFLSA